jgi:FkbM family methyltransferase
MQSLPISIRKRLGESIKAGCRFLARPLLPMMPDALANRLPFLGRICVHGPHSLRVQFHTYGPHGKDRIAIKLARHGLSGYEGETIRLFLALVQDAKTVVDIGANTGLFALLAASAKADCRVWAFEPVPFIFEMLQANRRLNRLDNLEAVPQAVADFVGESTFYITRTNVGIPTDSSSCQGFREQVEEFRFPTTTLDEYARSQKITRIDLLKIDAEAAESKVIRGAQATLRTQRPLVICEVLENVDHGYVQQTMQDIQYRFYHISADRLQRHEHLRGSLDVDQRNYLLVPKEKLPALTATCAKANIRLD